MRCLTTINEGLASESSLDEYFKNNCVDPCINPYAYKSYIEDIDNGSVDHCLCKSNPDVSMSDEQHNGNDDVAVPCQKGNSDQHDGHDVVDDQLHEIVNIVMNQCVQCPFHVI